MLGGRDDSKVYRSSQLTLADEWFKDGRGDNNNGDKTAPDEAGAVYALLRYVC